MWQAAAALTARTLTGTERAQALSRWASHVQGHEGSTWRCVGILTAAGCLQAAAQVMRVTRGVWVGWVVVWLLWRCTSAVRNPRGGPPAGQYACSIHNGVCVFLCISLTQCTCVHVRAHMQVLRNAGLPDCAYAYVQACRQAGLLITPQVQQQQQQQGAATVNTTSNSSSTSQLQESEEDADAIFGAASQHSLELFDILGLRTRMLLQSSNRPSAGTAAGEASSGPELLQLITSEYHQYLCRLISSL